MCGLANLGLGVQLMQMICSYKYAKQPHSSGPQLGFEGVLDKLFTQKRNKYHWNLAMPWNDLERR